MKGSLIFFCVLGIQLSQFGTNGQLIELDMTKPKEFGNYFLQRMLRGAHNIMNLPLVRKYPKSQTSRSSIRGPNSASYGLQSASEVRPQYSMPKVSHNDLWGQSSANYHSAFQIGYEPQPQASEPYTNNGYQTQGGYENHAPSYGEQPSSSYGSPNQFGGDGWGSSKGPYKRICKLNQGPVRVINSAADLPPGSTLRDPFGVMVNLEDVVIIPVPSPPNVLRVAIRDPLPSNYSTQYVERLEVNLDPTGNLDRSPFDVRMETHYRGNTRLPSDSILNPNNQRPKANTLQISTFVVQTPNISAPLNGVNNTNGFFQSGIDARRLLYPNRVIQNPLETQLRVLGQVFDQIQTIEDRPLPLSTNSNNNRFATGAQVDAPLLGVQIQRFTIPEPNSGERSILDSYFNFGLPAHTFEFGDLDIVREQYEVLRNLRPQVDIVQLGSTSQEISDNLTDWIRRHVKNLRDASAAAFRRGELIAYEKFGQHQFFIYPPGDHCPINIDPHQGRGATNMQCSTGGICLKGRPPRCIPPTPGC